MWFSRRWILHSESLRLDVRWFAKNPGGSFRAPEDHHFEAFMTVIWSLSVRSREGIRIGRPIWLMW